MVSKTDQRTSSANITVLDANDINDMLRDDCAEGVLVQNQQSEQTITKDQNLDYLSLLDMERRSYELQLKLKANSREEIRLQIEKSRLWSFYWYSR